MTVTKETTITLLSHAYICAYAHTYSFTLHIHINHIITHVLMPPRIFLRVTYSEEIYSPVVFPVLGFPRKSLCIVVYLVFLVFYVIRISACSSFIVIYSVTISQQYKMHH